MCLPKLTGRKEISGPVLNFANGHIKARRNDPTLVETTCQVDHNLTSPVIINNLKFADVTCRTRCYMKHIPLWPSSYRKLTMFHHHSQKLDDNFGTRSDEDLAFTAFLGIIDRLEGISQRIHSHHFRLDGQPERLRNWNIRRWYHDTKIIHNIRGKMQNSLISREMWMDETQLRCFTITLSSPDVRLQRESIWKRPGSRDGNDERRSLFWQPRSSGDMEKLLQISEVIVEARSCK